MVALVILLFLLPLAVVLYNSSMVAMKSAVQEGQQKTSAQMAVDIVTDYMRQFANDPYNGHYDSASLGRPQTGLYANVISSISYVANPTAHTLYLNITAGLGNSMTAMTHPKHIEALIVFISDMVLYGSMFYNDPGLTEPNVSYGGPFAVFDGGFTEGGTGCTFTGPIIVGNGPVSMNGDTITGNLYLQPAHYPCIGGNCPTVDGTTYNHVPTLIWPTINTTYYSANAAVTITAPSTITFTNPGGVGKFTVIPDATGVGTTYTIPANGAIIYAQETHVVVNGTVNGLVTVVSYSATVEPTPCYWSSNSPYDSTTTPGKLSNSNPGSIIVSNYLEYPAASPTTATPGIAFSAVASNCIGFMGDAGTGNLTVTGVYFVLNPNWSTSRPAMWDDCNGSNCNHDTFTFSGTRNAPMMGVTAFESGGVFINYDPGLRLNQPPGLPEYAYLVNFNVR
jgi:hypothetical protein